MFGGDGDDELDGNEGNDTFLFNAGFGRDTIQDFRSEDVIEFRDGRFGSFDNLRARASQSGGDTIINDDGGQLILQNVQLSSLAADDFRFT